MYHSVLHNFDLQSARINEYVKWRRSYTVAHGQAPAKVTAPDSVVGLAPWLTGYGEEEV